MRANQIRWSSSSPPSRCILLCWQHLPTIEPAAGVSELTACNATSVVVAGSCWTENTENYLERRKTSVKRVENARKLFHSVDGSDGELWDRRIGQRGE